MNKKILGFMIGMIMLIGLINLSSALIIDGVSMSPTEIAPGESAVIKIELENNGEEDIENVGVSLNLEGIPFAPFNSASDYNIEEIDEGDEEEARFEIIALNDAKSGIYKIPIEITYIENDVEIVKDSLIGITVNSEPVISVIAEDGLLLKGTEKEILVEVTNKGLSDAKFLEIEIMDSMYFKILSSKTSYIGDVDSNDFDSAKFKIYFNDNAPDKTSFPVIVHYKDGINNGYTENFNIYLEVYSRDKAIELGLIKESRTSLYVGIIVVLIIIYFIYKKIRNSRRARRIEERD